MPGLGPKRVFSFPICPLQTSHWLIDIDWQLCGYRCVKAGTRNGLEAVFGQAFQFGRFVSSRQIRMTALDQVSGRLLEEFSNFAPGPIRP